MRSWVRERNLGGEPDGRVATAVGMEPSAIEAMFRLLAIAKYDERYVIPQAHGEIGVNPHSRKVRVGSTSRAARGAAARSPGRRIRSGTRRPSQAPRPRGGNVSFLDFRKRS